MFLARASLPTADGASVRLLASADPGAGWTDIRSFERISLERSGASARASLRLARALVPGSTTEALEGGERFWDVARAAAADTSGDFHFGADQPLICPVDPPAYRDFMVFEQHFSFGYTWQNKPVPDVLYEFPISYMGSTQAFIGPEQEIFHPHYTAELDVELEIGIVLGKTVRNIHPDEAPAAIAGLTILNDISARDIQRTEMTGSLGPSKAKHFASVAGPWIATLDEIPASGMRMQSWVNGEPWVDTNSAEAIWSIGEIVAWAAAGEILAAGTLLGTGTCNGGSGLEIGKRLAPGDEIEFEVERLGHLRNRVGEPVPGWLPTHR